jgi:hypothetical protein
MQGKTRKNQWSPVMKGLGIFILAVLVWLTGSSAKAISFTEQNFAVEFPPAWQTITPPPEGLLMALRSPDRSKAVAVNATELPESERATGIANALAGAKKIYIESGLPTDPEQSLTINGVPFRYFVGHPTPTNASAVYAAMAGNELYTLVLITKSGDASRDPDLQTVLQSFRLITPVEVSRSNDVTTSISYKIGHLTGLLLFGILGIAIVGWLVRSVSSRSKTSSTGGVPPPLPPQAPS